MNAGVYRRGVVWALCVQGAEAAVVAPGVPAAGVAGGLALGARCEPGWAGEGLSPEEELDELSGLASSAARVLAMGALAMEGICGRCYPLRAVTWAILRRMGKKKPDLVRRDQRELRCELLRPCRGLRVG